MIADINKIFQFVNTVHFFDHVNFIDHLDEIFIKI